jgi:hypothetical protein
MAMQVPDIKGNQQRAERQTKSRLTIAAELSAIVAVVLAIPGTYLVLREAGRNEIEKGNLQSEKSQEPPGSKLLVMKPPPPDEERKLPPPMPKEPPPGSSQKRRPTIAEIESRPYPFKCPKCKDVTWKTAAWILSHEKLKLDCKYDWPTHDFRNLQDSIRSEIERARSGQ